MRRFLRGLRVAVEWLLSGFIAILMILNPVTQPILAGIAIVPIAQSIREPYARAVVTMVCFIGFMYLMLNWAEIAAIIAAGQVRRAFHSWGRYIRQAHRERLLRSEVSHAQ